MRRVSGTCLMLLAAAGFASSVLAEPPAAASAPKPCVEVRGEASFASVGYDHLVHLTNGCKKPMACTVKTDVNPDATQVELAPGESKTLVTWRGSPAREFKPDVTCKPL